MVQARTPIMNQLQAVALNEGLHCEKRLWLERGRQQLESFQLAPWASRRRSDLLELMDRLNPTIAELTQAIEQEVQAATAGTHQGSSMLRFLLVQAAQVTVRSVPEWRSKYLQPDDAGRAEDCESHIGIERCHRLGERIDGKPYVFNLHLQGVGEMMPRVQRAEKRWRSRTMS
jgi:hypothetical protein